MEERHCAAGTIGNEALLGIYNSLQLKKSGLVVLIKGIEDFYRKANGSTFCCVPVVTPIRNMIFLNGRDINQHLYRIMYKTLLQTQGLS